MTIRYKNKRSSFLGLGLWSILLQWEHATPSEKIDVYEYTSAYVGDTIINIEVDVQDASFITIHATSMTDTYTVLYHQPD